MASAEHGQVRHLNPGELPRNPAFTNVVVVTGPAETIYIGGQDAVDAAGKIVGKGDVGRQAEQVLSNLKAALESAGAGLEHVVKWNVYIVQGQSLPRAFEAFRRVWGRRPDPPAISLVFVSALADPDFLVEMDAIAVIPK